MNLPKEDRDRLGDKSLKCYGTRSKWRKLCESLGLPPEHIEYEMDKMLLEFDKGERVETIGTKPKQNRKYRRAFQKFIQQQFRKQARYGQASNGVNTSSSPSGSGESDGVRSKEVQPGQLETGIQVEAAAGKSDETPSSVE